MVMAILITAVRAGCFRFVVVPRLAVAVDIMSWSARAAKQRYAAY